MTYSIVAVDEATGDLGVCVTTTVAAVGALAPQVSLKAAVSSQAYVNVDLGLEILERVEYGQSVEEALKLAVQGDEGRDKRQVIAIGKDGLIAGFTGQDALPWRGHLLRKNHAVAGNLLTSQKVLEAMSDEFEKGADKNFVLRLIESVEAGLLAGGEVEAEDFKDTVSSAAVIVASEKPRAFHNLRVDASYSAIADLKEVFAKSYQSALALEEFYQNEIEVRPTFWRKVWNGNGTN